MQFTMLYNVIPKQRNPNEIVLPRSQKCDDNIPVSEKRLSKVKKKFNFLLKPFQLNPTTTFPSRAIIAEKYMF